MFAPLLDILFPPLCMLCNEALLGDGLCVSCAGAMENITNPICVLCGVPFPSLTGPLERPCSECLSNKKIPFVSARSALFYSGTALEAIHDFKYYGKEGLKGPLGRIMADALERYRGSNNEAILTGNATIVTAVPLHRVRLRERGYNQSLLLAGEIAKRLSMELDRNLLKRVRLTKPQVEFSGKERRQNVRGAFELSTGRVLHGKEVLLIDDVYTTGATVTECARLLKEHGASVYILTLARAISL